MNFKQLSNGMSDGFVLLKKCEEKKTKNGSAYLDLIIGDKDEEMSAKLWDYSGDSGVFEQNMVVKIRGNIEQYNGKDQFRIAQLLLCFCVLHNDFLRFLVPVEHFPEEYSRYRVYIPFVHIFCPYFLHEIVKLQSNLLMLCRSASPRQPSLQGVTTHT